jgi:DNA-binding LytR/AlgR family response regulator
MKVMIVDDEPLARKRLRKLVQRIPELTYVGEAENGRDAQAQLSELAPDLLLLDIDMPGLDGMALARTLDRRIHVVFTTAHREHAVEAFRLSAVDYLLKPIDEAELREAVARVRERREHEQTRAPEGTRVRLSARRKGAVEWVESQDITRLHAADKYVVCRIGEREYLFDESLSELEHKLSAAGFLRVHRGELVNLARVRALRSGDEGALLELDDGQQAHVSRRSLTQLKQRLGLP